MNDDELIELMAEAAFNEFSKKPERWKRQKKAGDEMIDVVSPAVKIAFRNEARAVLAAMRMARVTI